DVRDEIVKFSKLAFEELAKRSPPASRDKPGAVRPKKKRKRDSRIGALLFALLEGDRRHLDKPLIELARLLRCHVSSVSRALHHREYGPRIQALYRQHCVQP